MEALEEEYCLRNLNLPSSPPLQPLLPGVKLDEERPLVPRPIREQSVAFFFERASREFLESYGSREMACGRSQTAMLQ
jgi:hypothetical protein